MVTVAKHVHEVESATDEAVKRIKQWLESAGLELAAHKTLTAVLITSRKTVEYANFRVGNQTIRSKESLKYLGVMLDNRLRFKTHVEYSSKKASLMQAALSRMLPNIGGSGYARRMLLFRVVSSVLLYAAPIWAGALATNECRRKLSSAYRLCAIRVISGFRTISDEAACVLAGMVPIDIIANEMQRVYLRRPSNRQETKRIKEEERAASAVLWQARWDSFTKGRWTHRLIPTIESWTKRARGNCNYHLTQFLSGHGGYRKYLHRFGHDSSPLCPECPNEEEDDSMQCSTAYAFQKAEQACQIQKTS